MRMTYFTALMLALAFGLGLRDDAPDAGWMSAVVSNAAQRRDEPVVPLEGLDPVMLVQGKEAQGDEQFSVTRGRFRYLFASAESKAAFEREPARYEIQLGGTCARMGPGVRGNADLYLVHNGRIYIFGSPDCLKTFQAAPDKYLDTAATTPAAPPSAESLRRGRALVEKAVEAAGGARRIDALKTYRESATVYVRRPAGPEGIKTTLVRVFPDRYREERVMSFGTLTTVVTPDAAFGFMPRNTFDLIDEQRADFERRQGLTPISLLRARLSGGYAASAAGAGRAGESPVELVDVRLGGTTARLGIDPTTGRILSLSYRGRGHDGTFGEIVRLFSDFRTTAGVTLPFKADATFNGQPETTLSYVIESITLDAETDASLFERPKPAAGQ